jgi:hypothetical protein
MGPKIKGPGLLPPAYVQKAASCVQVCLPGHLLFLTSQGLCPCCSSGVTAVLLCGRLLGVCQQFQGCLEGGGSSVPRATSGSPGAPCCATANAEIVLWSPAQEPTVVTN